MNNGNFDNNNFEGGFNGAVETPQSTNDGKNEAPLQGNGGENVIQNKYTPHIATIKRIKTLYLVLLSISLVFALVVAFVPLFCGVSMVESKLPGSNIYIRHTSQEAETLSMFQMVTSANSNMMISKIAVVVGSIAMVFLAAIFITSIMEIIRVSRQLKDLAMTTAFAYDKTRARTEDRPLGSKSEYAALSASVVPGVIFSVLFMVLTIVFLHSVDLGDSPLIKANIIKALAVIVIYVVAYMVIDIKRESANMSFTEKVIKEKYTAFAVKILGIESHQVFKIVRVIHDDTFWAEVELDGIRRTVSISNVGYEILQ